MHIGEKRKKLDAAQHPSPSRRTQCGWRLNSQIFSRVAAALLLVALATACSEDDKVLTSAGAVPTSSPGAVVTATAQPPASQSRQAITFSDAATITATADSGDKATLNIKIGTPMLPSEGDPSIARCNNQLLTAAFEARSRLVPVLYTVKFESSLPGAYHINIDSTWVHYAVTKPAFVCGGLGSVYGDAPQNVQPGSSHEYMVWFFAEDVITPAKPNGDWQAAGVNEHVLPLFAVGPTGSSSTTESGPRTCSIDSYVTKVVYAVGETR